MRVDTMRASKREQIVNYFKDRIGHHCPSIDLHARFGPAFRTRVSEINRDVNCPIRIVNKTSTMSNYQRSMYWAETKEEPNVPQ